VRKRGPGLEPSTDRSTANVLQAIRPVSAGLTSDIADGDVSDTPVRGTRALEYPMGQFTPMAPRRARGTTLSHDRRHTAMRILEKSFGRLP
jgi:hypothetical protein